MALVASVLAFTPSAARAYTAGNPSSATVGEGTPAVGIPDSASIAAHRDPFPGAAVAGYEQFWVTGLEPGLTVDLVSGRGRGDRARRVVDTATVDDQGSVLFREVSPGRRYRAHVGRAHSRWMRVRSVEAPAPDPSFHRDQVLVEGYQYIETRDGTTLSANIVLPGPPEEGPYPTVVEYSGYDPSNPTGGGLVGGLDIPPSLCVVLPILCKAPAQPASFLAGTFGYAVVGVNVRGTGCSGGAYDFFERMQLLDGYDVIETVAAQPWVKGNRVGMVGLSYPGITQLFVGSTNPPSLAAITPLSVYGDTGTGIATPGGINNSGFALSWAENVLDKAQPYGERWTRELIEAGDTECDANQKLRLQNVDAAQKALDNPFYTEEIAAPLDTRRFVGDIEAAVFMTSAWQDEQTGPSFGDIVDRFDSAEFARYTLFNGNHADGFAPQILAEWAAFLDIYVADDVPAERPIVAFLTPLFTSSIFGASMTMPSMCCTAAATAAEARAMFESEAQVQLVFENGGVPGADEGLPVGVETIGVDDWPVPGTEARRWYFDRNGTMSPHKPAQRLSTAYFSPDPTVGETTYWDSAVSNIWHAKPAYDWQPAGSGEAIAFETPELDDDLTMAGTGSVDLWVRSTAPDADLEVILSEIRPDGREMLVQTGLLRASYRKTDASSTELKPVQYGRPGEVRPLKPRRWNQVRIQIPAFAHEFRTGSRLRVTINTPGGDEPQWAYILSDEVDGLDTHYVSVGRRRPSSVALPVVDEFDLSSPLPACPSLRGQPCRPAPPIENQVRRFVRD